MAKIKLTKNELKRQRDALKRYTRYLPTLELKKRQLLTEIRRIQDEITKLKNQYESMKKDVEKWIAVFSEKVDVSVLFSLKEIETEVGNIAGTDIPLFEGITFEDVEYDLMKYPLWVDVGIETAKTFIAMNAEIDILKKQEEIVQEELRTTVQRINLFDKILIPQTQENIRKIRIFLGDQQTASVVRGKIAKSKLEKKKMEDVVKSF
ncbi:MAG: V-type ATP synthase subunit D [Candidatus Marinimicrobia bacterium]|nr:V-type ATP synthase subunit D [Candidatus Neomarinimicrobiota bacterium]MDD5583123.1 V-type ATP synthase subunit D [Candidatus Neomarinimicrobiota bacterium]